MLSSSQSVHIMQKQTKNKLLPILVYTYIHCYTTKLYVIFCVISGERVNKPVLEPADLPLPCHVATVPRI